jgi:hypothetical protein
VVDHLEVVAALRKDGCRRGERDDEHDRPHGRLLSG